MWYTLAKGLGWFALAGGIGICIGWLLRSIVARRQIVRARGRAGAHSDAAEVDRLRRRIAELESVVVERDDLQQALADCRDAVAAAGRTTGEHRVVGDAPAGASADTRSSDVPSDELAAAAAVLGHAIEPDDLKVVEGIGPNVEALCHGIGIRTWSELAGTEVSLLRTMLTDAGPRFRTHDPSTWPHQAQLLAAGRWDDFRSLVDELRSGRTSG